MKPVPFVVGLSRSGTTLLRMMLDSHPDLAIPFETHFLPAIFAQVDPPLTRDMFFERVVSSPGWPNMAIANEQFRQRLDNIEPFDTVSGVRAFFLMCAERFGKQRWGDKTPAYLHQMTEIQERLPEAHFIHIIRDGRDVAISHRGLWWGPGDDAEAAARFWRRGIESARRQSPDLRKYLEIRYEDLVNDPFAQLAIISRYLDLDYDPAMLGYFDRADRLIADMVEPIGPPDRPKPSVSTFRSIHERTRHPPDQSRIGRWRLEMTDADQQIFETEAGSVLKELGYETRFGI